MNDRRNCILCNDERACNGMNCRRCGWDVSEFNRRLVKIRTEGLTEVGQVKVQSGARNRKAVFVNARGLKI